MRRLVLGTRHLCSSAASPPRKVLIANRGEIALRIARAANELGISSVALVAPADRASLHATAADAVVEIPCYNDASNIIRAAQEHACDAVHPGYGFLSESAAFARQCEQAGVTFIGPSPATLKTLGDKVAARELAQQLAIPVAPASPTPCVDADEVRRAMAAHDISFPVMLKAVGGGGGRGMRPVHDPKELDGLFAACTREADAIGAAGGVFVEQLVTDAQHVEVQLLGDGGSGLVHLFERDCSVQRRRQKLIESSPAIGIDEATRQRLFDHALAIGHACQYRSAGTCEFLVRGGREVFLEFNPRIQVEHPVSEEVTGIDIVRAQLLIAGGASLASIGLPSQAAVHRQHAAIQARVQMVTPGHVATYSEGGGIGIRVDGSLYPGYLPPTCYDPLLVKVIARAPVHGDAHSGLELARRRLLRACGELHVGGSVRTNLAELAEILRSDEFEAGAWSTARLDEADAAGHALALGPRGARADLLDGALASSAASAQPQGASPVVASPVVASPVAPPVAPPVAAAAAAAAAAPEGCMWVVSSVTGQVVAADDAASVGDAVQAGETLAVISSMKMEFAVPAPCAGLLEKVLVGAGKQVALGEAIALLRHGESLGEKGRSSIGEGQAGEGQAGEGQGGQAGQGSAAAAEGQGGAAAAAEGAAWAERIGLDVDLDGPPRPDLARVLERRRLTTDEGRSADGKFVERLAKRSQRGQRTARVNVASLVDDGSFYEYGRFAVAAQRGRRSLDDLMRRTPADGMVCGIGSVNGAAFGPTQSKTALMAYDATVLAGTQGVFNHWKTDRILQLCHAQRLPLILLAEGGGGRPGDVDADLLLNSALSVPTFRSMGSLSGLVPLVGIASGFCFAGNAALLGACDVVIATAGSNIGMAGPAMIEGGGLGKVDPSEIGPCSEQAANGVVDLVAADEAQACELARNYLSYFQGALPAGATTQCADQRLLRSLVPQNRKRLYDVRRVVATLADEGSWLELRRGFAPGLVSGLLRIEGRPVGVVANSSEQLGGAVSSDGALKAARFMELCDAFDIPMLMLCDTPGFMVGPESERTAAVRKMARLFGVASSLSVPFFSLVLRRAYGLGAMAMTGGMSVGANSFHASWPSAEAGPMGLEGAVELGFANELATASKVPLLGEAARQALFNKLLAKGLERAEALSVARTLETDDVIDPADSRDWIVHGLDMAGATGGGEWRKRGAARRRSCVSPW